MPYQPPAPPAFWLVKSEPFVFSFDHLVRDGRTCWEGVRNYQARNHLRAMREGDICLFYHSNEGLAVVGVAKVAKEAYQDPTTTDERWVVVDLKPEKALKRPVTLEEIKKDKRLQNMKLIKQGRLSVQPVAEAEFDVILALGAGK